MKYDTRTNAKMKEICLKTALSIMFPAQGLRNKYVTAIMSILAKNTEWVDQDQRVLFRLHLNRQKSNRIF